MSHGAPVADRAGVRNAVPPMGVPVPSGGIFAVSWTVKIVSSVSFPTEPRAQGRRDHATGCVTPSRRR